MKSLKEVILEAKLSPEVVALANVLKAIPGVFLDIDPDTINKIKSTFTKVDDNDTKGRRWRLAIDNTFSGETIMVALTTGEWRYQEEPKKSQEKKSRSYHRCLRMYDSAGAYRKENETVISFCKSYIWYACSLSLSGNSSQCLPWRKKSHRYRKF